MPNHRTPSELADELQMEQQEVIGKCQVMAVPMVDGKIDKYLFRLALERHIEEHGEQGARAA